MVLSSGISEQSHAVAGGGRMGWTQAKCLNNLNIARIYGSKEGIARKEVFSTATASRLLLFVTRKNLYIRVLVRSC
jgi:hypothetical protein